VTLYDGEGRAIATGRTVNISEHGVAVLTAPCDDLHVGKTFSVEIDISDASDRAGPDAASGIVTRPCRIVRIRSSGGMVGLGLEFISESN